MLLLRVRASRRTDDVHAFLVGDAQTVAARLQEDVEAGANGFVLSDCRICSRNGGIG
jgi:alkanesulfonate monooxygenase SsuD/methylene tetrahydromethanopterin reductase-like flavin-dependent oxidoreductase (luciferase family)